MNSIKQSGHPAPSLSHLSMLAAAYLVMALLATGAKADAPDRPNIVYILADDLGYGDIEAFNFESSIPTPHINRLAEEGMRFTDAHSPSSVCTPTRYATLTGRYCWRTRLTKSVLAGYSEALIAPDRPTIATMLRRHGYHTAVIGKWHIGMGMPAAQGGEVKTGDWKGDGHVDYAGLIKDGPASRGFHTFFGISASLDMPPYVWIENDRFTMVPKLQQPDIAFPGFTRVGPRSEDFIINRVLDDLGDQAEAYIVERAQTGEPFFLYLPLTAPHGPVAPSPDYVGSSPVGPYGDFVMNVDGVVGQVIESLKTAGISDRTIVVFTSDNGSFMQALPEGAIDHVTDASIDGYAPMSHRPNSAWRGRKTEIYEGGHRVPMIVKWPGSITPGGICSETVTHTDFYATFAQIVGTLLDENEAEDSTSMMPLFTGNGEWRRGPVVHHSASGMFAIRDGNWKLILGNGSGGWGEPRGKPFAAPYQLYNLQADPHETRNVIDANPQVAADLESKLKMIRQSGRSR